MGLSYDFTETGIPTDDLYTDDNELKAEYMALVFLSMPVGLPGITAANVDKFIGRATLCEKIHGPMVSHFDDGKWVSAFSPETAKRCIGLRVNVAPESRTKFLTNITRGFTL